MAQGEGMCYPALARRNSSVGEDKASCMTRMSLADLVAARENVLSQYFQTLSRFLQTFVEFGQSQASVCLWWNVNSSSHNR